MNEAMVHSMEPHQISAMKWSLCNLKGDIPITFSMVWKALAIFGKMIWVILEGKDEHILGVR